MTNISQCLMCILLDHHVLMDHRDLITELAGGQQAQNFFAS